MGGGYTVVVILYVCLSVCLSVITLPPTLATYSLTQLDQVNIQGLTKWEVW